MHQHNKNRLFFLIVAVAFVSIGFMLGAIVADSLNR